MLHDTGTPSVGVTFGYRLWKGRVGSRYVEMVPGAGRPEHTWVPKMVPGTGGVEVHYRYSKEDPYPIVLTAEQAEDWREHVLAVLVGKLGFRLTSGRKLYEYGQLMLFEYWALPDINKTFKQFWACTDGKWRPKFKWTWPRACIAPKTIKDVRAKRREQTEDERQAQQEQWRQAISEAHSGSPARGGSPPKTGAAACIDPSVTVPEPEQPRIAEAHQQLLQESEEPALRQPVLAIADAHKELLSSDRAAACIVPSADVDTAADTAAAALGDRPQITKSHTALLESAGTGSALRWDAPPPTPPPAISAAPAPAPAVQIGYWSIRGLGAPLRMLCVYAGQPFENVMYDALPKPGSGWDVAPWFEGGKPALAARNPLMNLPYVQDGELLVAQSNACLGLLARKLGLAGATEAERARVEQVLCQAMDLRLDFAKLCYAKGDAYKELDAGYAATVASHFAKFDAWLAANGTTFAATDAVSAADFCLWELIDAHITTGAAALDAGQYPALRAYYDRFAALEAMQPYLQSEYHQLPVNNRMASLGQHGVVRGQEV
eukprot:g8260.t1